MGQGIEFQKNPEQPKYERVLISINIIFTTLFTIECVLKLLAFGIKVWNVNLYTVFRLVRCYTFWFQKLLYLSFIIHMDKLPMCQPFRSATHFRKKNRTKIILPQQNSFEINSLQIQEIEIHLSEIKVRFKLCSYQRNVLTGPSNWVLSLWKHRWSRLGICLLRENYSAPVELICLMLFILIQFIYICSLFCYCLSSVALLSLSLYS